MTPECAEAAITPGDDLGDVEVIVAEVIPHVRVGRVGGFTLDATSSATHSRTCGGKISTIFNVPKYFARAWPG